MTTSNICILIAVLVYMAFMLFIGFRCSKKNKSTDDFYLGGRKLGPIVTAMSAEASDMSGWLLMGLPGVALLCGLAEASWTAIGLAIGTYVNWLIVAKRIRLYTQKTNSITVPEFFRNRYHDKGNALLLISALIIVIFFIPYTASGFKACGTLFSTLFGIEYHTAMIVSAIVIVGYTVVGGFLAASTTDLVQSIIMSIALVVVFGFGISRAGGIGAVIDNAKAIPEYLSLVKTNNIFTNQVSGYGFLPIVSTLAWGLGYFGMPHILLRFMAIEDEKKLGMSRRIATIWVIISMAAAVIIGVIGNGMISSGALSEFVRNAADSDAAAAASETVIINIATLLSNQGSGIVLVLLALVAGIILSGIFASTMSTADSQLLAAASAMSENILHQTFWKKMPQKLTVILARVTVLLIAVVGVVLAWNPNSSVFRIVSFAWAGFGATFGPVVLCALFWKRSNKYGALAGLIAGGAMVFIWKFLVRPLGGAWNIYELLPAFIVALIAIVVVSLLTKKPEDEVVAEFDAVNAEIKG